MPRVQITDPAKVDIQEAFSWWSENRSVDQAALWYRQITEAIGTLQVLPDRCPLVPESTLSMSGVRQLLFGVGSHPVGSKKSAEHYTRRKEALQKLISQAVHPR